MKKRTLLLTLAAVALVLCASLGTTLAYFTDYAYAKGSVPIVVGNRTTIDEEFSAWVKHVTVTSEETNQPVYVRVRAFAGKDYNLSFSDPNGLWTRGSDDAWYYTPILNPGETTEELLIRIVNPPVSPKAGDDFQVVVVYESTAVRYRADGTPYADWNVLLSGGEQ